MVTRGCTGDGRARPVGSALLGLLVWASLATDAYAAPYPPTPYGPVYGAPYHGPVPGAGWPPAPPPWFQGRPPAQPQGAAPVYPRPIQPEARQARPPPGAPPRLECLLTEERPYVQQALILQLDLVTSDNLGTLDLELPVTADAMLARLDGPRTSARLVGTRRELVNRFLLSLVPLRPGVLELPGIRVVGTLADGRQGIAAVCERPLRLQVRPAVPGVTPWLPLRALTIEAGFDRAGPLDPGEPVTLTLEISALGGTAGQLPSLGDQLAGPDLRAYREQSATETGLSPGDRRLVARRVETYTLVPQTGGHLTLPEMAITWWNLERGAAEVARLPIKSLAVSGGAFSGLSSAILVGPGSVHVWLGLVGLALLFVGYSAGVHRRGRPLARMVPSEGRRVWSGRWRIASSGLLAGIERTLLSLRARLRSALISALPPSYRFRRSVRRASLAADPATWCRLLEQEQRAAGLGSGPIEPAGLAARIRELGPGGDAERLRRLVGELEAALYGGQALDFARWKREVARHLLRRGCSVRPLRGVGWAVLPPLNPP